MDRPDSPLAVPESTALVFRFCGARQPELLLEEPQFGYVTKVLSIPANALRFLRKEEPKPSPTARKGESRLLDVVSVSWTADKARMLDNSSRSQLAKVAAIQFRFGKIERTAEAARERQ